MLNELENKPSQNLDPEIMYQVRAWGLEDLDAPEINAHAERVLRWKGSTFGEILLGLELIEADALKKISTKHSGGQDESVLAFLRDQNKEVSARFEEILAIQYGLPYLSKPLPSLIPDKRLFDKNKRLSPEIQRELDRYDALLLWMAVVPGKTVLLFGDVEKMLHCQAMGRADRLMSPLFRFLAEQKNTEGKTAGDCPFLLGDSGSMIFYRQLIADMGSGKNDGADSIQSIEQHEAGSDPVISAIIRILNEAILLDVNDVCIVPGFSEKGQTNNALKVFFRKHQQLIDSGIMFGRDEGVSAIRVLMARSRANDNAGRLLHPSDGKANFNGKHGQAFLRMSFIPLESSQGEVISSSIRVLPRTTTAIDMRSLNIIEEIQEELVYFATRSQGLFVVCGPTGSGKSTTIASMLCQHERAYGVSQKRISVEDPCERKLPGVLHIDVSQHRYTDNSDNFAKALRSILRHDPDVIFVGEVRDRESCAVSIDAANTGHLVFTTTHANDPVLGYRRLASLLPRDRHFDLVNVLEGILAQRLVKIVCPHCSDEKPLSENDVLSISRYADNKGLDSVREQLPKMQRIANPSGCPRCIFGYSGMLPVHGLLSINPEIRRYLLSSDERDWMKVYQSNGHRFSLFGSSLKLFREGVIDLGAALL